MENTNTKNLKKSVLLTLVYYKALDTPLTLIQLDRYLLSKEELGKVNLSDVREAVEFWKGKGIVEEQKGLFQIKGASSYWERYAELEKASQKKIKRAVKALKYFSFIPSLKALFICGSVARKTNDPLSDIDFLILTKRNRVWTVRFFLTILTFLMGNKTNNGKERNNKFCLNHYRDEDNLLLPKELQDTYSACEYSRMLNVYSDQDEISFYRKNRWINKMLPHFDSVKPPLLTQTPSRLKEILDRLTGSWLENILRRLQLFKISRSSKKLAKGARLVTENGVIMFHLSPRAPETAKRFELILEEKVKSQI